MLVADALSCYASLKAQEISLDITIKHMHITPDRPSSKMTHSFTLSLNQSLQVGQMISMMCHMIYAHTMATGTS